MPSSYLSARKKQIKIQIAYSIKQQSRRRAEQWSENARPLNSNAFIHWLTETPEKLTG